MDGRIYAGGPLQDKFNQKSQRKAFSVLVKAAQQRFCMSSRAGASPVRCFSTIKNERFLIPFWVFCKVFLCPNTAVMSLLMSLCAVLFPTRCLGWNLGLNWVGF